MANPGWVSVPLEGWSHSQALARIADVHLVTHARNRENLMAAGLREGEQFRLLGAGGGVGWTTIAAFGVIPYYLFESKVWARFADRLRRREFDLVHRLTPLSPTTPSTIAARCARVGVPFTLGPLNGGVPWPKGFHGARLSEREFLSYVRGAHRLLPAYRDTREKAKAIIAGSRDTRAQIHERWQEKTVYIPENGVDPSKFDRFVEGPASLPLRVVFAGRLVPYKCADLLLLAAAPLIRAGKVVVEILGDGPEMPKLRAIVAQQGLGQGVELPGWVKHADLKNRLVKASVFGFPSVREFGGAVVLEAMVTGLVPIVVDYGGPAELVSTQTGFRVPMGSPADIVRGFREVLEKLAAEPGRLREMGQRGRERVRRNFTWDAKAAQTLEVWRWALGLRDRPDFGMPLSDPS